MKKRILSWLLCLAMLLSVIPSVAVQALAAELSDAYTISNEYLTVSVSKKNGGFTVKTVEGDRLKKSDNNKDLLYHNGQYDTSFLSLRIGEADYLFGGKYDGSSGVTVSQPQENGTITASWSVAGVTITQTISLANAQSNESGMAAISVEARNESGKAVPVKARLLLDTSMGSQDYGYYQILNAGTNKLDTVSTETLLTKDIPQSLYAVDDPYSPTITAYSLNSGTLPYQVAVGHWSHLASTLFAFTPAQTLGFTNSQNEYLTADSAYALYFDLGTVANGGSGSFGTYYGVYSNYATPASDSVAVNLAAPVRLELNDARDAFVPQPDVKGDADFAVTVDFTNYASETAKDLSNVVMAVQTTGNLRPMDENGKADPKYDFSSTEPYVFPYADIKVGDGRTKTLYFKAKLGTAAAYERITIGIYDVSQPGANGKPSETYKLGERMAYILLPGTEGDVPQVNFAAMTPKIIYTEGTRHLFVTVNNETMLANPGEWNLYVYSEDRTVRKEIPHENITIQDGILDAALTEELPLSAGGWFLQLEWTDASRPAISGPETHFTVSNDKKYKNDSYGILAVVEYTEGNLPYYRITPFQDEAAFAAFRDAENKSYEEILLTFKGEFTKTKKIGSVGTCFTGVSTKKLVDGTHQVDNPIVINDCMDFEGGTLSLYYEDCEKNGSLQAVQDSAICTEFDGELYTNVERTSIWSGKAIFTKIEQGKEYSLIPYNENGVRGSYKPNGELDTDHPENFSDEVISLIWPSAAGIGQTLSGMLFKLAYGQLGIMKDTKHNDKEIGRVLSFSGALDLTFASGKVDESLADPPTYWSKLQDLWSSYNYVNQTESLYRYVYGSGQLERALDWSEINESGNSDNEKHIQGGVMVRDILFGCGKGFVGVNFQVDVAVKNYISGLPEIEGTIQVNTINDWSYGISGKIELANFTLEASVAFKSRNNVPVPDELYVFVSGFEPGLNIDGCGVVWLTGAGGGVKNLYDTIFCTQAVPPLKLLLSVSFDILKVLTCEKATLAVGPTGIGLTAENIGIKKISSLTAIKRMGLTLEWYPGIDLRANIVVDLFQGVIYGAGYIVLISPDYHDVFFEMFARAQLRAPSSIPIVGGMTLMGVDLGINSEKIWGALDVLFITLGVTYYWGESGVDFGSGSKSEPTFPDLLGYQDVPVYYDAEREQTLYARVGTNTRLMASNLPDDGGAVLMNTAGAGVWTEGNYKREHQFALGTYTPGNQAAIVQITFDAETLEEARTKAQAIQCGSAKGLNDYGLVLYQETRDQQGKVLSSNASAANASLTFDESRKKATYAFTATDAGQYGKRWYLATPKDSDVLLYNVQTPPEMTALAAAEQGGRMALSWDGSDLTELDSIRFYLCSSNDPAAADPGYPLGEITGSGELGGKAKTVEIPAEVPTGEYYVRAVYSKADEVNGVLYTQRTVSVTNPNTPETVSFSATAAGDLEYQITVNDASAGNITGYLVSIYDENGEETGFDQLKFEKEAGGTVLRVGGRYSAADPENSGRTIEVGLTAGSAYTVGLTPYHTVTAGGQQSVIYGEETRVKAPVLPEMKTPVISVAPTSASAKRTVKEWGLDASGVKKQMDVTKTVCTTKTVTLQVTADEAVSGNWKLDDSETGAAGYTGSFQNQSRVTVALSEMAEGEHTLTVQGRAADGDSFYTTYVFTVDTLAPQLLIGEPVNGGFYGKDGKIVISGVTDPDSRLTMVSGGSYLTSGTVAADGSLTIGELAARTGGTYEEATGRFSLTLQIPDPNSASSREVTITAADDVGNRTQAKTVTLSHGGLADLKELRILADGTLHTNGNLPVPAAGSQVQLALVGVTSEGTQFRLSGYNVSWELIQANGTAQVSETGVLTLAAQSQGVVMGKLAVTNEAFRTAALCYGTPGDRTVSVSTTLGGQATGGGSYEPGQTVTLKAVPDSGYRFAGWEITGAAVADLTAATITFPMPQSGNVTALAKFEAVVSPAGGAGGEGIYAEAGEIVRVPLPAGVQETDYLPCYPVGGGYEFVKISAVIDGNVVFLAPRSGRYFFGKNSVSFTDTKGHWGRDAITFAAARELFKGIGNGRFDPDGSMTRAMFATVLYRMAGSPAVSGSSGFTDVAAGQWYSDAILWGKNTGIIEGYGNGLFGTNDKITRAQMCVLLTRYLQKLGFELPASVQQQSFADGKDIAAWAKDGVAFCQTRGLILGRPNGRFDPKSNATRAENCVVFQRMIMAILSGTK